MSDELPTPSNPAPKLPPPEPDFIGYEARKGKKVIARAHCADCARSSCECLLTVMAAARKAGAGTMVVGPGGVPLNRRERVQ